MTEATKPEWQIKAEQAAAEREEMKRVTKLLTDKGVRFVEVHGGYDENGTPRNHMTLAYREDRRNVVYVATAIVHPNDKFNKAVGRYLAGMRLAGGHAIMLRRPKDACCLSNKEWLHSVFRSAM